ncbi:DNA gyrase subunit A [candidate division Kazan bacterium RIFCSPHIGHO2_01_FULL_44_14]|uniref:DNA gyrase subunit A n=1 Tax=candidate division Kazan bacterium RIFCSPLOWO2_01_FULL_45_19 TaxID=1798538 RepID=A0A1F4NP95_UNCK3|nr:MAG: DNA gyrase subunit A [candidate division Kazan bacterium RIFCSPLOWO2_01_FULL_45_19]OGB77518.1 MAG: DNA gyrase subunit A [candidate division Kazan bacterium RIFCSPHIGHO2_01_FULL_44_14]
MDDNNLGQIELRGLETEMQQSYLSYAMSVIVARALPDVRDGLKPVHRRILYAMSREGLRHTAKYSKSAGVVGEMLKKYHPHGDMAVYDAMVRLAQPWNMRYMLVDGQGNFGSIDGDSAAAYRYTEARLAAIADEVLADLDKETVEFIPNFDDTTKEPTVLPTKVPQLLMNGTVGIAVGMATSIPPHNLSELMDAIAHLIVNPESEVDDLMKYIKGPDFPTGGIIFNPKDIKEAYATGHGKIVMRAVAEIVEGKNGHQIIVSELPYQVNKSNLVESIADLVKNKKLVGIADLRDESDRRGIRIAVDLKRDAYPRKILNQLFKMTQMQSSFHVNLLALVDGIQPRVLDLRATLQYFIDHRRIVVTRRTQFELKKAEERAHILEGFMIALKNIDEVIKTIKQSATKEEAHVNLKKKFKLSDLQASAILEMRLSALAGLERKKVEDEYKEKQQLIKDLRALLADKNKIDEVIKAECLEIKTKYGDKRRTQISGTTVGDFTDMDLIPNEEVVVTMSIGGYIKRQQIGEFRTQRRGGKGVIGMTTKEEDQISSIQVAKNHDDILFFTNRGRVFKQKVFEVPKASRIARGAAVVNIIQIAPDELVTSVMTLSDFDDKDDLVMFTKQGVIKKTSLVAYANIRSNGLIAIKLDEGDELTWVRRSRPGDEVIIATRLGQSIRFKETDARSLGRSTRGVRAIKLRPKDEVIGADIAKQGEVMALLVISEKGSGKRTLVSQYTLQHRGGIGIKTMNITDKTGKLIGAKLVDKGLKSDMIVTSTEGQIIRMPLKGVPTLGRATQGVRLMRLKGNDKVASFTVLIMEEADGSLSNPNEELTESELAKLPVVEVMAEEEKPTPVKVAKPVSAKITKPSALVSKSKPSFAKRTLAKPVTAKSVSRMKAKATKPVAKKSFTVRKLAKPTKIKSSSRIKHKTVKQPVKSFTRRKLR